ncbi:3-oxoacyl-[acyl-carrier-protein] synthase III C-terminal domain-containing protein [Rugamonas sp.]|uniref:3-oxoacyl-[acyl-carrier-protein] synthase III C-terminal domain-containing protein n=1 Tax=Rugamonas sp. TaxID=1926287 RepID=UPI0025F7508D|nr:3-oxoacyl-[acyl-carrier-protein] synthase III C-terminal domain-containing protein [Rugamonas sp.]
MHAATPVLFDFTPAQVVKPVGQRIALEISAFGLAKGHCKTHQLESKQDMRNALDHMRDKIARYAVSTDQINRRQLVLFPRLRDVRFSDGELILQESPHPHLRMFRDADDTKGIDLKQRHASYGKIVGDCLQDLYPDSSAPPDDLIHVTCSGYLAPSPVERMVARKEWFDTTVTHSYHMGCYGAFPAIKMAHGFLASSAMSNPSAAPRERVDIVHTELLSGHHNIEDSGIENIITMSLFADGFIKYSLASGEYARQHGVHGLRVLAFHEHLLPDSADDMTWVPAAHQFQMTLSVMVPVVIKRHVRRFVADLLRRAGLDFERDKPTLMFAIHPGGPKIVEHIQGELGLTDDQVAISKKVFRENGNMSSATIPHILKGILEEKAIKAGTRVVSLGFGPGLTVTGLVLEKT